MSGRALGVLALLAALAVAAAWHARQPAVTDRSAADTVGERFLPGLAERLERVTAVEARVAGGAQLARIERAGGAWRVVNRAGYPADPETLRGTLIGLAEARRLEGKTDRPDGWPRLGVEPVESASASGVEIALEGLDSPLAVIIGKPSTGDAGGTYVRSADGGGRAWLVSGAIERPDRIADWLDDRLVDLPAERILRVTVHARDGEPVRIERAQSGTGFVIANRPPDRRPLSNSIARSMARIVTGLTLTDVHPAADVDRPPRLARARFETVDGLVITVDSLAAVRDGGPRYVHLQADTADDASTEVAQEAAALNARFQGWLYEIPDYKFVNASQTLAGVLEPERP